MRYLGLDVHSVATVYCVLDAQGTVSIASARSLPASSRDVRARRR